MVKLDRKFYRNTEYWNVHCWYGARTSTPCQKPITHKCPDRSMNRHDGSWVLGWRACEEHKMLPNSDGRAGDELISPAEQTIILAERAAITERQVKEW